GYGDHGCADAHAQSNGQKGECFAPSLAPEGFEEEAGKHQSLFGELRGLLAQVGPEMTIESPTTFDSSGIGLHPPACPTLAALMGAEQFLQMIPVLFL